MDDFFDWMKVLIAPILAFGAWLAWVSHSVWTYGERIGAMEKALDTTLKEFKATLAGSIGEVQVAVDRMRDEATKGRDQLYRHIDSVRRELKGDIKDGDAPRHR